MWKAKVKILDVQFQKWENKLQAQQEEYKQEYLQQKCTYNITFIVINTLFLIDSQITRVISSPVQRIPRVALCRVKQRKKTTETMQEKNNQNKKYSAEEIKRNDVHISQFLQIQKKKRPLGKTYTILHLNKRCANHALHYICITRTFIGSKIIELFVKI